MRGSEETQIIAGFDILAKLSSGGMGDVLLARRRGVHGFEKLLAIKTIRGDLAKRPDIRAMFLDEARLSARLDHPTIAQVYDFGEQEETLFLAMEYVPGIALNKLLAKRGGPIPSLVAMRIVAEVCRGLHAAHELCDTDGNALGVVHRDVTPGNLILTFDGHMKILDFGIAFMKGRESPDTIVGELKGKPSYMAPEHLRGEGVDRRADLYSISVVLHELLTGRKLFTRDSVVATVLAVETSAVPPPSSIAGPLSPGLDEIVLKGLERKKEDRFPDARAMAVALDRLIALEPSAAHETLEAFVESTLVEERDAHRAWLSSVLSGRVPSLVSEKPATAPPTPVGQRRDAMGAETIPMRGSASSPNAGAAPRAAAPLAESTTLIPPAADNSQQVEAVTRPIANGLLWAAVVAIALAGSFAGYRLAFDREEGPDEDDAVVIDKPIVADLPLEAETPAIAGVATASVTAERAVESVEPEASAEAAGKAKDLRAQHKLPAHRAVPKKKSAASNDRHEERTETRPAEERRPQGFGFVTVGAQPYALVRIDGQEIGATPIMSRKLPAGTHEIELVRPDSGEVRLKQKVTLNDGEHQRITIP
jgi:eukaryotic-like serine/threonine-protein kinase